MQAHEFDQDSFFRAIAQSGARALLIGRRAILALGGPVQTVDYDFWLHIDDIDLFNAALEPFELIPNRTAVEARQRGRYTLEVTVHGSGTRKRLTPSRRGSEWVDRTDRSKGRCHRRAAA